jgi:hypothetical protein
VDKNYGLSTFGMPDALLPQQKTTAPDDDAAAQPDLLKGQPDLLKNSTNIALPRARIKPPPGGPAPALSEQETPLDTTPDGSATDDTTLAVTDTTTSDNEAPPVNIGQ